MQIPDSKHLGAKCEGQTISYNGHNSSADLIQTYIDSDFVLISTSTLILF